MKNFLISIKITIVFCVVLFVGYVLVLWGIAFVVTPNQGNAEVVTLNGKVVGASNVGQQFTDAKYFWTRPSAVSYDGSGSGGSNKAISNSEYLEEVSTRIDDFLVAHPYLTREQVPSEMVTASASGLDPHISVEAAMVQAQRVAMARGISEDDLKKIIDSQIESTLSAVPIINVLKLNVMLDENYK